MSVLVYAEASEGKFKKTVLEAVSYGKNIAKLANQKLTVVTFSNANTDALINVGADNIIVINNDLLSQFNAKIYATILGTIIQEKNINIVITDASANSKNLAPLLAAQLQTPLVSNAIELPTSLAPFTVKRKVFSNKAYADAVVNNPKVVVTVAKNSFGIQEAQGEGTIENYNSTTNTTSSIKDVQLEKSAGKITIADADIVISGGRGLKAAENFVMLEEMADVLGAAVACSKPVSDLGWRPHAEHVGQTGKPVACNLYIAVAISGAIQHLAGVNASKVKVVINTDPEAPFFKAADYGIVGDAFEVIPALTKKLQEFKSENV